VNSPFYDLRNPKELNAALQDLRGFWKLWSACLLSSCGLPTLAGIIFTRSYPEIKEDGVCFLHELGPEQVLIRHDKRPEAPPHPRGGFLVGEALLQDTIDFFWLSIALLQFTNEPILF